MEVLCQNRKRIFEFLENSINDNLALGTCSKYVLEMVSKHSRTVSIEGKRLPKHQWRRLLKIIQSRFTETEGIIFRNSNITTDILDEFLDPFFPSIVRTRSTFCAPRRLQLRTLVLTKCFQISFRSFDELPKLDSLNSTCYGNLSRCRMQSELNYPNLRVLGLTNYQLSSQTESTMFLADLAQILKQSLPNLELLFLGGLKGYQPVQDLPKRQLTEEATATLPPKLKVIELTFWMPEAVETLQHYLLDTCWGQPNGPSFPQIISLEQTEIEELDGALSFDGWSEKEVKRLAGPAVRASTDCANGGMRRPLHLACMTGQKDRVEWLLCRGAHLNTRDGKGCTPILRAAEAGHIEIVKMLKDAGADLWQKNHNTEGLLYLAALKGHNDILELILPHLQQDDPMRFFLHDGDGFSPLHAACLRRSVSTATLLIEAGFDVNVRNKYLQTPLHLAARTGHLEMIQRLVDLSADLEAKDEVQCTPVTEAFKHNKPAAVQLLQACGASGPRKSSFQTHRKTKRQNRKSNGHRRRSNNGRQHH